MTVSGLDASRATLAAETRSAAWLSTLVPRLIAGLVILLAWELVVRGFAPAYVARPSGILMAMPKALSNPALLHAAATTLTAVAQGLAIAILLGTAIGLAIGRSSIADRMLRHYVHGFYAVPMIVILPLLTLWLGYTGAARLATIVFAALFAIIVNVADGARSVPREYVEVARAFRSQRLRMLFEVVLPASMPYFLAGLRLAAGRALIGAIVAEFFTAIAGLGYFILYATRTFRHDEAFVAVILLTAFGLAFDALVGWGTRRFLPWYRRDEKAE
jgi:ABC-type nitrate/sulfonate/bicarbonate transport system permease component